MSEQRQNDGRRFMPKLKCPYGNHRFGDVPDVALRNESVLTRLQDPADADFILECPHCHQKVALSIKLLHQIPTTAAKAV